jgi:putative DNA primase/helicase
MLGRAGIIRLVPDEDVTQGIGIAEGIETSLAVMQGSSLAFMQGFGWRPMWAAASAGGIRTFPVLPGIGALTIFADADGPGLAAARACAARWRAAGAEVRICTPPAGDFNDLLRRHSA